MRNDVHVGGCVYACVCVHVFMVLSGVVCNLPSVANLMWLYVVI